MLLKDPIVASSVLSCISTLFPFISSSLDVLPGVLDRVSNVLYFASTGTGRRESYSGRTMLKTLVLIQSLKLSSNGLVSVWMHTGNTGCCRISLPFSDLTLLFGQREGHTAGRKTCCYCPERFTFLTRLSCRNER